jgi:hypothetical protein
VSQELPKLLYHYCSLQGLRGIIEKKHLRMTSVFWMDDTTELFWFYEVVKGVLDRRPSDERNVLHERFKNMVKTPGLSYVFCTCFSKEPDSRSQWLEYADDGHGFAIGFDPTTFDLTRDNPTRDVELKPVVYDEKEQERIAEEVIRHLREHGNEVFDQALLVFTGINVWWEAAHCKNPAFVNEKEWRLIYRDNPGDALGFRERAGRQLIPFVKFPFDPAKNPISEIWLGPRNRSQRNVEAVAQLLRLYGYDAGHVRFPRSNIPLRSEY